MSIDKRKPLIERIEFFNTGSTNYELNRSIENFEDLDEWLKFMDEKNLSEHYNVVFNSDSRIYTAKRYEAKQ